MKILNLTPYENDAFEKKASIYLKTSFSVPGADHFSNASNF